MDQENEALKAALDRITARMRKFEERDSENFSDETRLRVAWAALQDIADICSVRKGE